MADTIFWLLMTLMVPGAMATAEKTPIRLILEADNLPVRKMMVHASNKDDIRQAIEEQMGKEVEGMEYLDPLSGGYLPLPSSQLPTRLRVRARLRATADDSPEELLALPWRRFAAGCGEDDGLEIGGRRLVVKGVDNSGQGTGHTTWDGAVVLAKYLERTYPPAAGGLKGKRVLETGAGTGLAGLSAALLGADKVWLTDLAYTLPNLRQNVARNDEGLRATCPNVEVREADWTRPPTDLGPLDLILAADTVWLNELVEPFVNALRAFTSGDNAAAEILVSYQSRSRLTDELLDSTLVRAGFNVEKIDPSLHHPDFRAPDVISIFRITRGTGAHNLSDQSCVLP